MWADDRVRRTLLASLQGVGNAAGRIILADMLSHLLGERSPMDDKDWSYNEGSERVYSVEGRLSEDTWACWSSSVKQRLVTHVLHSVNRLGPAGYLAALCMRWRSSGI